MNTGCEHSAEVTPQTAIPEGTASAPLGLRPPVSVDVSGDQVLAAIRRIRENLGEAPSAIPRCPSVRGVVRNVSGQEVTFVNPARNSAEQQSIPHDGAFMMMFKGSTLQQQANNAATVFAQHNNFDSPENLHSFLKALRDGTLGDYVAECYGPAPFEKQAKALVDVTWPEANASSTITPKNFANAAYGARPPIQEEVYRLVVEEGTTATLRGTDSVAEHFVNGQIYLAVSTDWKTQKTSTKPIQREHGSTFYGAHVSEIPTYRIGADGGVTATH